MLALFLVLSTAHAQRFMQKTETPIKTHADQATLVFVRPSSLGYAIKPSILDETGRILGESRASGWFTATIDPGEHTLYSWGEGTPTMKIDVKPGKIYYIEVSMVMGAWSGRARLIGLGKGRENWRDLPKWMRKKKPWSVDDDAAKAYADSRRYDIEVVIDKGNAVWSTYAPDVQKRRSLGPKDGLSQPVY